MRMIKLLLAVCILIAFAFWGVIQFAREVGGMITG